MVLNSLVVSLIPVAILSLQVANPPLRLKPVSRVISCRHQSQLDTDGQGVLRNIWLTAARLSIAGAVSIGLNMIIKVCAVVRQFVLKLHEDI